MMRQTGFVFDLNRCTGCSACAMACSIEASFKHARNRKEMVHWDNLSFFEERFPNYREVSAFNEAHHPSLPSFFLSLACNHCETPACMLNCPALAYSRDPGTGAVLVNPDHCMGCKYCTWACPYDAPKFDTKVGVIRKCDFCVERLKQDQNPACVVACPVDALNIENHDPTSALATHQVEGFPQTLLNPSIRFVAFRPKEVDMEEQERVSPDVNRWFMSSLPPLVSKISLKSEWTLFAFSLIAAYLTGFFGASVYRGFKLNPIIFLGSGVVGMMLSSLHLGNKKCMYRAIFNLRRSWLSREVFFMSAFLACSALSLIVVPESMGLKILTCIMGGLGLVSIDKVYGLVLSGKSCFLQSAGTVLTGLFIFAILSGLIGPVLLMGALKTALFLGARVPVYQGKLNSDTGVILVRVFLGLIVPISLMFLLQDLSIFQLMIVLGFTLIGEGVDRADFYHRLQVPSPKQELILSMKRRIST